MRLTLRYCAGTRRSTQPRRPRYSHLSLLALEFLKALEEMIQRQRQSRDTLLAALVSLESVRDQTVGRFLYEGAKQTIHRFETSLGGDGLRTKKSKASMI